MICGDRLTARADSSEVLLFERRNALACGLDKPFCAIGLARLVHHSARGVVARCARQHVEMSLICIHLETKFQALNCWAALKPSECDDVSEPSLCYLQNKLGLLGMKEVAASLNLLNLRPTSVAKKEGYVAFAYQTAPLDFTVEH